MYSNFFGFSVKPFELAPDPRFLYLNEGLREALATLVYGIQERRGFILMTGEPGTGKTTMLNAAADQFDENTKVVRFPRDLVEESLRGAALWSEVNDKLDQSGYSLSGGQQQRLCIARTIAVKPDIILMDEPASALDPIATLRIEELMRELPPDMVAEVRDFIEFLLSKRGRRAGVTLRQDWAGTLREHRQQYTSLELQHRASKWRGD